MCRCSPIKKVLNHSTLTGMNWINFWDYYATVSDLLECVVSQIIFICITLYTGYENWKTLNFCIALKIKPVLLYVDGLYIFRSWLLTMLYAKPWIRIQMFCIRVKIRKELKCLLGSGCYIILKDPRDTLQKNQENFFLFFIFLMNFFFAIAK